MMRLAVPFVAALALSACAVVPPPAPTVKPSPAPPPAPAPPPPPISDWQDRPMAPGLWALGQDDVGSVAKFGEQGLPAIFMVRCIRASRRVAFLRAGTLPDGVAAQIALSSTEGSRIYAATNAGALPAYVRAETPASDPELDRLAFSRGRFLVAVPGMEDLVLPSWPEFAKIIEDCRS